MGRLPVIITVLIYNAIGEPNPPKWPNTVSVFSPGDSGIQDKINQIFSINGGRKEHGQFSPYRFAMMFKPGTYTVDVPIGYYTSVHGLGESPHDVIFSGAKGVYCEEGSYNASIGALDNFWRSAEGFTTKTKYPWFSGNEGSGMMWAVSQAAPLRRTVVENSLVMFEYVPPWQGAGEASGGFIANVKVGGHINTGSQQQCMTRNCEAGAGFNDGVWNMVMVGSVNTPAPHCGHLPTQDVHPYIVVSETPVVAEMPFISVDSSGKFSLQVPALKKNSKGVEHTLQGATTIPFEQVYVTQVTDTAATMNSKLAAGLHLVISPAIYQLTEALKISHNNQVILGLGIATLVSAGGNLAIDVASGVDGVHIAGLLLQAGPKPTPFLLRWGTTSKRYGGDASNPGFMHDVFARVGGPDTSPVQVDTMVQINSGNIIIDNTWLWRADHTKTRIIKNSENPCRIALQVNGDDVTGYGLAVEHTLGDMMQWSGNNGEVYFFQSEYPYDVTQANYGDKGFVAYRVNSTVTSHKSWGAGVYHFFRDHAVTVHTGISCPASVQNNFIDPLGVYLNGLGTMTHIINTQGQETSKTSPYTTAGAHPAWWCH